MKSKALRVRVYKRHIKEGSQSHFYECPVSLALQEAFAFRHIGVIYHSFGKCYAIIHLDNNKSYQTELPTFISAILYNYDHNDKEMQPFQFSIPLEQEWTELDED